MEDKVILLVEDNSDDADLTVRALRESRIKNPVKWVEDGVEALAYLHGQGTYAGRDIEELPQVVLLDLNMPKLGGLAVLKKIREHPVTQLLPVVILTTSKEDRDLVEAYQNHANSFICKPVDFLEFTKLMGTLGLYWILINETPSKTKETPGDFS